MSSLDHGILNVPLAKRGNIDAQIDRYKVEQAKAAKAPHAAGPHFSETEMRGSKHHYELTNGKGKCSVPMWCGGVPAGFCDKDAFGEPIPSPRFRNAYTGAVCRMDGKYDGYVPGLACPNHGGPDCPGIEIEGGVWSGCSGTGGDCPTCGN